MKRLTRAKTMQRQALTWRLEKRRVVIVPTMGFLHAGHAALIKRARRIAGKNGRVVVSIFVNPTQFAPNEDLERYPRSENADFQLCRTLGVDAVFLPPAQDIYPKECEAPFSTFVTEESLSTSMEGRSRPIHFRGVATIVVILFNLTQASHAVFGEKDFQQAAIIIKMAKDLKFPTRIIVAPTVREADGLAKSSRNAYLSLAQRENATILWRCIEATRTSVNEAETGVSAKRMRQKLERLINRTPEANLDYIEFFNPKTLAPVSKIQHSDRIALAIRFGKTRLIDNGLI